jgi:hypothetical protein
MSSQLSADAISAALLYGGINPQDHAAQWDKLQRELYDAWAAGASIAEFIEVNSFSCPMCDPESHIAKGTSLMKYRMTVAKMGCP